MSFATALVTGASGFIGRALVAHLRKCGKRVVASGRPGSALPPAERQIRLEASSAGMIAEALHGEAVDVVFHCAAYGVRPQDRDHARMFETNVVATGTWVEAAASMGARRLRLRRLLLRIWARGERPSASAKATHSTRATSTAPRKQREGDGARLSARSLGLPFQWVRLFGVFGPGEAPHRLLPYVHDRLSRGERVDLTAGLQWRDLLYVEDAAKGLLRAAEIALEGRLGPFNLCTGEPVTVRAMAEEVARQMGAPPKLLDFGARAPRADEQMWMVGDGSLLAHAGGFRHSIGLSDGVARTLRALDPSGALPA